jgi:hypothetical protein
MPPRLRKAVLVERLLESQYSILHSALRLLRPDLDLKSKLHSSEVPEHSGPCGKRDKVFLHSHPWSFQLRRIERTVASRVLAP